jgi:DNA sulfur modification protein DndD
VHQEDLSIEIYDSNGKKISKKSLSSGERQIFAISILWALKKISNRPIPVIIDTPLSRLDSDHRKSIIQNFFPMVSHQTIILSTDTEVNKGYFRELSEHVSQTYHLRYDKKERSTIVEKGYFKQGV